MTFIDQHYCFDGSRWSFPDLPLVGAYRHLDVYQDVTGWESFESTLSRMENIEYGELWKCAAAIPHEWIEWAGGGLFTLIETLHGRPSMVRDLIMRFRDSSCNPFPSWTDRFCTVNLAVQCP